jgi:NAD(P)-dependent dehydrogenase (short-subunit alcohol dehydrogenase family)
MAFADAAVGIEDTVVLTTRRPDELHPWAQEHGDPVLVQPLDVTDPGQVTAAVRAAEQRFGGIDVLVNNAGRGWYGSIEGMADEDIRKMFEPGAFRTRAYTGFAEEPIRETIEDYLPMLDEVRTTMIDQDGKQPGDPHRGVRAVITAMAQDPPPRPRQRRIRRGLDGPRGRDRRRPSIRNTLAGSRLPTTPRSRTDRGAMGPPHRCPGIW